MTVPGNLSSPLLATAAEAAAAAGEVATRSLRFNNDDSANLSRTFTSAGNRKTWTWAGWVKRCSLGTNKHGLFGGSGTNSIIRFNNDDGGSNLRVLDSATGGYDVITQAKFYDVSAWYHFAVAIDTTESTAADRVKIYVNGVKQTSFHSASYPTQNAELTFNNNISHTIGTAPGSIPFDGYLADVYFIDGLALDPVDNFIELDSNNNYQARAYSGTFGTNGFHLKFDDASSNAALGTDSSGNDNTFTVNNITVNTSGTNYTNISTLAALSGSSLDSSYNDVSKVFDGSGTGVRTVSEVSNQGEKLSITFNPTITLSNETVSIDTSGTYQGMFVTVDGSDGSRVSGSDSAVTTLTTGSLSGSLSKITVDNGIDTSGRPASIVRIRIGGTVLLDPVDAKDFDSMFDAPTNGSQEDTGAGGEVSGNYAVLNPLVPTDISLSNGNLDQSGVQGKAFPATIAFPSSGKWYFEVTTSTGHRVALGIMKESSIPSNPTAAGGVGIFASSGRNTWEIYNNGSRTQNSLATPSSGDTIGVAYDADANTVQFYKGGSTLGTAETPPSTTEKYFAVVGGADEASSSGSSTNFGQRAFANSAPTNFKPLCTALFPTPDVANGETAMTTDLYTGTGASHTRSGFSFSPDFVWIKVRSAGSSHRLFDTVRGAGKHLLSNGTSGEETHTTSLSGFTSDGFTLGANAEGSTNVNQSGSTYAAWCWDAGSTTDTNNTDGSITPTGVRANQTAGFSVVTYTGTGSNATVGHGLSSPVKWILVKDRSQATGFSVYHDAIGTSSANYIELQSTAVAAASDNAFQKTAPTSSVFSIGTKAATNESGDDFVAWCWSEVEGFSKFGEYTGATNLFVYTGFKPQWLLIKSYAGDGFNWVIIDDERGADTSDVSNKLYPNKSSSEDDDSRSGETKVVFLSNGFVFLDAGAETNSSSRSYIYACFASHPINTSRGGFQKIS